MEGLRAIERELAWLYARKAFKLTKNSSWVVIVHNSLLTIYHSDWWRSLYVAPPFLFEKNPSFYSLYFWSYSFCIWLKYEEYMSLFKFLNESLCKLLALSFSFPMYIHHKVLSSVPTGLELFNRTDLQNATRILSVDIQLEYFENPPMISIIWNKVKFKASADSGS